MDLQKLIEEKKPDDGTEQVCVLLKMGALTNVTKI